MTCLRRPESPLRPTKEHLSNRALGRSLPSEPRASLRLTPVLGARLLTSPPDVAARQVGITNAAMRARPRHRSASEVMIVLLCAAPGRLSLLLLLLACGSLRALQAGIVTRNVDHPVDGADSDRTFVEAVSHQLPRAWAVVQREQGLHTFKHVLKDEFYRLSRGNRAAWTARNRMYTVNASADRDSDSPGSSPSTSSAIIPHAMLWAAEKALSEPLVLHVVLKMLFASKQELAAAERWADSFAAEQAKECSGGQVSPCFHVTYQVVSGSSVSQQRFESLLKDTRELMALLRHDYTFSFPSAGRFVVYVWDACQRESAQRARIVSPLLSIHRFALLPLCTGVAQGGEKGKLLLDEADRAVRTLLFPPQSNASVRSFKFPLAAHVQLHITPHIGPSVGSGGAGAGWVAKLNRAKLAEKISSAALAQQEVSVTISDPSEGCEVCLVGVGMATRVDRLQNGELSWSLDARVLQEFFEARSVSGELDIRGVVKAKGSKLFDTTWRADSSLQEQRLISAREQIQVFVMESGEHMLPLRDEHGHELSMLVGSRFAIVLHFPGEHVQRLERRVVLAVAASQFALEYGVIDVLGNTNAGSKEVFEQSELIPGAILRVHAVLIVVRAILRRCLVSTMRNLGAVCRHGVELQNVLTRAEFEEYTQRMNLLLYKARLVRQGVQESSLDAALLLACSAVHDADAIEQILRIDAMRDAHSLLQAASSRTRNAGNFGHPRLGSIAVVVLMIAFSICVGAAGVWVRRRRKRKAE
ncbi:hypothetical protein FVE85_2699 [Porphyridium purpureum]|uniref:Uncharacterized protein n=1 Tax=Porphyridium purpureum TaxID=35688 RepID=A0A5J4YTE1_PORPP|nr:hypothetical protein FVE85_2699 [Porphyridium purpureum]|eukprot:POR5962..scf227_4